MIFVMTMALMFSLVAGAAFAATRLGDNGPNRLVGTNQNDVLRGFGGNDKLFGLNDSDRLFGGRGNDVLNGGDDGDDFFGGPGRDLIQARDGDTDRIRHGPYKLRPRPRCSPGR